MSLLGPIHSSCLKGKICSKCSESQVIINYGVYNLYAYIIIISLYMQLILDYFQNTKNGILGTFLLITVVINKTLIK